MDVVLVNVEVWVHDRDGVPIHGLTAADFEVREDGVPMPITHFAEVRAMPSTATRAPSGTPPEPPPATEPPAAAPEEPGHLVIYFDQLHLTTRSVRRAADELKAFFASGPTPAERVLVVRQAYELYTEAGFGSTREQIEAALAGIANRQTLGEIDPQRSLARLQAAWERAQDRPDPCRLFVNDAKSEIASSVAVLERSSAVTLESLRRTARLLSGVPGPKTLLFISESLETRPGAHLVRFAQNVCPGERELVNLALGGENSRLSETLVSFAHEANRNRITVYPFQASGLRSPPLMGAEQGSLDIDFTSGVDTLLRSGQRDGLLELARQTGGWAVVNRNKFRRELERVAADMTGYYSLAYQPPHAGGEGNHRIEVRARGERAKNARFRHRLGYRDRGPDDGLQERLAGAIAFGATRNPLGVRLAVGVLAPAAEGRYALPVHVLVPTEGIAFLPQQGGDRASIEVTIHAGNARSKDVVKLDESFRPARPTPASQLLDLRMILELPAGVHVIAVAVRDGLTRESSVVATTVAISDPAAAGAPAPTPGGARKR